MTRPRAEFVPNPFSNAVETVDHTFYHDRFCSGSDVRYHFFRETGGAMLSNFFGIFPHQKFEIKCIVLRAPYEFLFASTLKFIVQNKYYLDLALRRYMDLPTSSKTDPDQMWNCTIPLHTPLTLVESLMPIAVEVERLPCNMASTVWRVMITLEGLMTRPFV